MRGGVFSSRRTRNTQASPQFDVDIAEKAVHGWKLTKLKWVGGLTRSLSGGKYNCLTI